MRETIPVTDPDDPRIADYRAVRERDLVGREGRFVIEGEVVLRLAARRGRFPLVSALLSEKRAALAEVLPDDVPVYVAGQPVMDAIAGFPIHRGVLAIGRRGEAPDPAALLAGLPPRAVVVALIGLTNHDNVGGIFRNAAAFGAQAVLLDSETCDPLYRKAIRVSAGGALVVPFARAGDPPALIATLEEAGFTPLALSPRGAFTLASLRRPDRVALLLGAEGPGLPEEVLARARTVRIPMAGDFDSLNVAVTSGIALHALAGPG
ncbi:RNA methyltransferase [Salinarimonas sp.]|uniref:TrmH family RNA methyltransferase n=1 Tax=Salinarimonas sp. TaxID=2766526 RepID=UPI0032D985B4